MNFKERMAFHYRGGEHDYSNQHPFLKKRKLYAAGNYGRLEIAPAISGVAENEELVLTYRLGSRSLRPGNLLKLFVVGFNPFSRLTTDAAQRDAALVTATIIAAASNGVELEVRTHSEFNKREIYLGVAKGELGNDDAIEIRIGAGHTLALSEIARPVTFYLEFRETESDESGRLIDRARLRVTPGPAKEIHCLSAPLAAQNEPLDLILGAVDEFGNWVDARAEIEFAPQPNLSHPERVELLPGDGEQRVIKSSLTISAPGVYRLGGRDRISNIEFASAPICCTEREPDYGLYFGDLHAHDFLSPGLASPLEYYQNARRWGLDFVALPIQAQSRNVDAEKWAIATFMAEEFYEPGAFVTFPAIEWQHYAFGHKNVYYVNPDQPYFCPYDERYDTVKKLYAAARQSDVLIMPHHPGYRLDCHVPGTDWSQVDDTMEPVAEICSCHGSSEKPHSERPLNAPGEENWLQNAWARGMHIGVIGGSDSHTGRPANSVREPRPYPGGMACVYATELTRQGLFEAFCSRRCYATTGARIVLEFEMNSHPMGEIITAPGERVVRVFVAGTAPLEKVEIIKNNRVIHSSSSEQTIVALEYQDRENSDREQDFYYIKIVQDDGEIAWSSPIWVRGRP